MILFFANGYNSELIETVSSRSNQRKETQGKEKEKKATLWVSYKVQETQLCGQYWQISNSVLSPALAPAAIFAGVGLLYLDVNHHQILLSSPICICKEDFI
ncbi:hypothetical protein NC651_031218 [Populus alba x Populus x berolinensis]|nr:hypothetical protein NC651_031218 [Populus alba x Populus x berolinensis]